MSNNNGFENFQISWMPGKGNTLLKMVVYEDLCSTRVVKKLGIVPSYSYRSVDRSELAEKIKSSISWNRLPKWAKREVLKN